MFSHSLTESFKSLKTPFYYYDLDLLERNLQELRRWSGHFNVKVHYALKANVNGPILKMIKNYGLGADCVSGNEIRKAIENDFPADDIVFAGVGKTDDEIRYALKQELNCLNVESVHELKVIDMLARGLGLGAPVALRINPDVNSHTIPGITTGKKTNKFGIDKNEIPLVLKWLPRLSNINFKGLHFHIGSQITDLQVFSKLAQKINQIQHIFIEAGYPPSLLNLGGGLGIDYANPDGNPVPGYENYFMTINDNLQRLPGQELYVEPGRAVVGQCGSLISSVLFLKNSGSVQYAILDAGMNNLIRPALYRAEHKIQNLTGMGKMYKYHIAGPVCESSDVFGKNVLLPEIKRGDLIVIRSAGAYGEVMASGYNLREPARAVYSHDFVLTNLRTVNG